MVSIIIPVYNQEKYLLQCIKSVMRQTYDKIEVILVDDGSTDSSKEICDNYKDLDNFVVIHQSNGGLSFARNIGMKVAKGDYITFLDSDDFLASDSIETLVYMCENYNSEISILNMKFIAENDNEEIPEKLDDKIYIFTSENAIEESLYQKKFSCCAPGKLYKKEVLDDIEFPLNMLSEDLATCHKILSQANKVIYKSKTGYFYRQQKSSIMHIFKPKRLDALLWATEVEKYCSKEFPKIISAARCRTFNVSIHLLLDIIANSDNGELYKNDVWKHIKRTRLSVIFNKKVRQRERFAALLTYFGENVLTKVWNSKMSKKKIY